MNKTGKRGPSMDAKERDAIIAAYKTGKPVNSDRPKSTLDKLAKIAEREARREAGVSALGRWPRTRNKLALSSLPDLVAYAVGNGWKMVAPNGNYEVARLIKRGRPIAIIHRREANNSGTPLTHLTTHGESENLRLEWMEWRMANEAAN